MTRKKKSKEKSYYNMMLEMAIERGMKPFEPYLAPSYAKPKAFLDEATSVREQMDRGRIANADEKGL